MVDLTGSWEGRLRVEYGNLLACGTVQPGNADRAQPHQYWQAASFAEPGQIYGRDAPAIQVELRRDADYYTYGGYEPSWHFSIVVVDEDDNTLSGYASSVDDDEDGLRVSLSSDRRQVAVAAVLPLVQEYGYDLHERTGWAKVAATIVCADQVPALLANSPR